MKGHCQGCGQYVTIDCPPDGHTRSEHDLRCKCYEGGSTCPVPVLCGPVVSGEEEGSDDA